MNTPILKGEKRSKFNFMKIEIDEQYIKTSNLFLKKNIALKDITSWIEIRKKLRNSTLEWLEFTIFTTKNKYTINSLHWNNYNAIKQILSHGVQRDAEKENRIYNSFWH